MTQEFTIDNINTSSDLGNYRRYCKYLTTKKGHPLPELALRNVIYSSFHHSPALSMDKLPIKR